MMRKYILLSLIALTSITLRARNYEVKSPDGRLTLSVDCGKQCKWAMSVDGLTVSAGNRLGMETKHPGGSVTVLGDNAKVQKVRRGYVCRELATPLYRQKSVQDEYNWLTLSLKGGYDIELRAYDEASPIVS